MKSSLCKKSSFYVFETQEAVVESSVMSSLGLLLQLNLRFLKVLIPWNAPLLCPYPLWKCNIITILTHSGSTIITQLIPLWRCDYYYATFVAWTYCRWLKFWIGPKEIPFILYYVLLSTCLELPPIQLLLISLITSWIPFCNRSERLSSKRRVHTRH
jgi:hypothetical protein